MKYEVNFFQTIFQKEEERNEDFIVVLVLSGWFWGEFLICLLVKSRADASHTHQTSGENNQKIINTAYQPCMTYHLFFFLAALRGMWDLSSLGIEPMPPAVEAGSLNHWTAREVPDLPLFWLI